MSERSGGLVFKKENGPYPLDIRITTIPYEEVMEDDEIWKGWESTILDLKTNKIITKLIHGKHRDRVMWVQGFFKGLEYENSR